MPVEGTVETASLDELRFILQWLDERPRRPNAQVPVLVGGWAVYAYNPYAGSVDIDLVLNNRTRQALHQWLCRSRGFRRTAPSDRGWKGIYKPLDGQDKIIIDTANRDETYAFEGREEHLNFSELEGRSAVRSIEGLEVVVPQISLLALFKAKAAFDRGARLRSGRSRDPRWEEGKLRKDRADLLALVDRARTRQVLDIRFMGRAFERFPFLFDTLRAAGSDADALLRYGGLAPQRGREVIQELAELLSPGP